MKQFIIFLLKVFIHKSLLNDSQLGQGVQSADFSEQYFYSVIVT